MRLRAVPQIVALAMLASLLLADPAAAQLTRGGISGIVRDQQGAVVPGATVTVKNLSTGAVRSAVTDLNGLYRVPALEPGLYMVRTELAGFSTVENPEIRVIATQDVTHIRYKIDGRRALVLDNRGRDETPATANR